MKMMMRSCVLSGDDGVGGRIRSHGSVYCGTLRGMLRKTLGGEGRLGMGQRSCAAVGSPDGGAAAAAEGSPLQNGAGGRSWRTF